MKNKISFCFIIFFPIVLLAQPKKDSTYSNVLPTDIYDNFNNKQHMTSSFTIVTNKKTEKAKIQIDTNVNPLKIYESLTKTADTYYNQSKFDIALKYYDSAFAINNNKGMVIHRYNAACCCVHLNNFDKAFGELKKIAFNSRFYNAAQITEDNCFKKLQKDSRWEQIIEQIEKNRKKIEEEIPIPNDL